MTCTTNVSRRRLLVTAAAGGAALLAAPYVKRPAWAQANTLTIGDGGGAYTNTWTTAFYEPFFEETGIQIIPIERRDNPAAEVRAMVETGSYRWDMGASIGQDVAHTLTEADFIEPLDLTSDAAQAIPDSMKLPTFVASDVAAFVNAYRTDSFDEPITSYQDVWDVERFQGRRGLRSFARDTLQIALLADGVDVVDIPTVLSEEAGWERAFAKLDEIRPHVDVWWRSASQTPTLLQSGELDICPTFNSRAQSVIDQGVPVEIVWNGGFYTNFGWLIPKGSPKADLAREFIAFTCRPEQQAVAASILGVGPSNPNAFNFIEAERARNMPTLPENLAQMGPLAFEFWGPIQAEASERFDAWLLGN